MKPSAERIALGLYWDRAWSLVEGCTPVSPACDHCWAAAAAHMRKGHPNIHVSMNNSGITTEVREFNGIVRTRNDLLDLPSRTKKPTVFAVWTDLFHEQVSDDFIERAAFAMSKAERHIFLILTKRPERSAELMGLDSRPHIRLGVTAENQKALDERVPFLLKTRAAKLFVSVEPMLGPVDLIGEFGDTTDINWLAERCPYCGFDDLRCTSIESQGFCQGCENTFSEGTELPRLDWVICGGESGPAARPMQAEWVRSLRDQCKSAGVAFWFKGWGKHVPPGQEKGMLDGEIIREWPE